jgi:hypothetical protein
MAIEAVCLTLVNMTSRGEQVCLSMGQLPSGLHQNLVDKEITAKCLTSLHNLKVATGRDILLIETKEVTASSREAKQLALTAANCNELFPVTYALTAQGTGALIINKWVQTIWNRRWNSLKSCRQTKIWFVEPDQETSRLLLHRSRIRLGIIIQFLTGHCWLNRHCQVIDPSVDPLCRLCFEGDEDPGHLWMECPALVAERSNIIRRYQPDLVCSAARQLSSDSIHCRAV